MLQIDSWVICFFLLSDCIYHSVKAFLINTLFIWKEKENLS